MADYKAIHGKNILHVASDLDNAEGEGQIWFNTTSSDYKTIVKVAGSWSTGGNLNTGRRSDMASGTQTASLYIAGNTGSEVAVVESYDGSSWTEVADINTARSRGGSAGQGTPTASLIFGDGTADTESFDGSTWTEVANLNTPRGYIASFGTSTAAVSAQGYPPNTAVVEEWNGTSWTEVTNTPEASSSGSGSGTLTAGLLFGGFGAARSDEAFSYDGTNWAEVGDMNTARHNLAGAGAQTSTLAFGGDVSDSAVDSTESYDGSAWTEVADMSTARIVFGAGGASNASSLAIGGNPTIASAEEWTVPQNVKVITD